MADGNFPLLMESQLNTSPECTRNILMESDVGLNPRIIMSSYLSTAFQS
jgi:hypothetical protein